MSYNNTFVMQPAEQLHAVDGQIIRHHDACNDASCHQAHGNSAKDKLNSAGQAIKHTAEKIGDKAVELKDKAKDAITGN